MRINSVDNTNFQMALKLNSKKMPDKLREMPMEYIIAINEFGNRMKKIKLYDVVFEDCFIPQVRSANPEITKDYFKELKSEEKLLGKWYEVPHREQGKMAGGFYPDEPRIFRVIYGEDAFKYYKNFKKLSQTEQAGELSRLLELRDLRIAIADAKKKSEQKVDEISEKARKEQCSSAVNDLMDKYAMEETAPPKKKWYQKIFFL